MSLFVSSIFTLYIPLLYKSTIAVFFKSDPQLLLRVHHDGTRPGHRFADGLAGQQQKAHGFTCRGNDDLPAITKEHQFAILRKTIPVDVGRVFALNFIVAVIFFQAEARLASNDIGKDGISRTGGGEYILFRQARSHPGRPDW